MRRNKPLSVRVRNPTRGLVTRLPSELADEMRPGDVRRTFYGAQNVRFEDGVVCAAPGHNNVHIVTDILDDLVSHWRMDEVDGSTRLDSHGSNDLADPSESTHVQIAGKIGKAVTLSEEDTGVLQVAHNSTLNLNGTDFTISGWVKFTTIAGSNDIIVKSDEMTEFSLKRFGTSLTLDASSDGDTTFVDVTPAVTLVANTWYFFCIFMDTDADEIGLRVNAVEDTASLPTIYAGDNPVQFGDGNDAPFYLDSVSWWSRLLSDDERDSIYSDGAGRDYPFLSGPLTLIHQGNIIDDTEPKPLTVAAGGNLFGLVRTFSNNEFTATLDQIYSGAVPTDDAFGWSAVDFFDKEIYAQHDNKVQAWKPALSATYNLPGLPVDDAEWDGVESFFNHILLWRGDRMKWSALNDSSLWLPVASTASSWVTTTQANFTQPANDGSVDIYTDEDPVTDLAVVVGQYIRIDTEISGVVYSNFYVVTGVTAGAPGVGKITATLMDLTGNTNEQGASYTVPLASTVYSVDANEAGEARAVGSKVNGPIFRVLAQGDYAYVFKERSIQSMQYVSLSSGVFFLHPEISDEGLLARSALIGLGDGRMVFVGHREIYSYQGGPTLTPIVQQFSRQFFKELDRARLNDIRVFHKELKNEVWIQYPVLGGHKVLIWNYREDSASIDIYDSVLGGITAIEDVEWPVDPSWESLAESITWENFDPLTSWADMAAANEDRFTLAAMGDGSLKIHGFVFSRDGEAYKALAETMDFDCDEPDIYKYVDVIVVGLQVLSPSDVARRVYVQLGYRAWMDTDISWTTPLAIQVQGNSSPPPVKINPGGAGRFLRLRFYSEDANVDWRITSYEIHCRPGSTY